jgi:hypothetical protein
MGCQHLDDFYELYLLGAHQGKAAQEIQEHVERGCPDCLDHLREAAQVLYALSRSVKPARPDPGSRARCLKGFREAR